MSVMDGRTRNLLYDDRERGMGRDTEEKLEDRLREPLTDLDAITSRLDTIELFVSNEKFRNQALAAVSAFNFDYEGLYESINQAARFNDESLRNIYAPRIAKSLQELGALVKRLPKRIPKKLGLTPMLQEFIQAYNTAYRHHGELREFFDYTSVAAAAINADQKKRIEEAKKEGKRAEQITYAELATMVDIDRLAGYKPVALRHSGALDTIAPYVNHAKEAKEKGYTRPEVVPREENVLIIREGKWAPLARGWGSPEIVANDTYLDDGMRVEVLEGVNAGGKTIDLKRALYIQALAQAGFFIPADYARVSIRDGIYFREKGRGDTISAFQQDCKSVREIFPPEGEYWLIAMDETFTSTERKGGEALTYGLVKAVLDQENSLLLISSHYNGLSARLAVDTRVAFSHFPFMTAYSEEAPGGLAVGFTHEKETGPMTDMSYALAVAQSKRFDPTLIALAAKRLEARGFSPGI